MKIVYAHLLPFFKAKPSIETISEKLLQLGHENQINNNIIDIEFTPNRGDCLSLNGISRDLNVFFTKTNHIKELIYTDEIELFDIKFVNEVPDACSHITFLNLEIENLNYEYCDYLESYFTNLNIKKTNFFTDVANYVAYEIGQPLHTYDKSSLGSDLRLCINQDVVSFETIIGKTITLGDNELVFKSDNTIINIAGIMGGIGTSCNKNTKNIILECAYFQPKYISNKATKFDINSDSSYKFERGTDPLLHELAIRRFIKIIQDHTNIIDLKIFNKRFSEFKNKELDFLPDKINQILGTSISSDQYLNILEGLHFIIADKKIVVPSFRSDISTQNDLAEEVARVIGYDNIPPADLKVLSNFQESSNEINNIKSFFVDNGFTEVINNPFTRPKSSNNIIIDNPIDSSKNSLRVDLKESLVNNLVYNEKRQQDSIKIFEISDIYSNDNESINVENKIAMIVSGRLDHNPRDFNKKLDQKYLLGLFKSIGIEILKKEIQTIDRHNIDSKIKTPIYYLEIKLSKIIKYFEFYKAKHNTKISFKKYKQISEFPSSTRDISISIKNLKNINDVVNIIDEIDLKNLKNYFMFDFYENKETLETKIGYRFIFQSHKKTLTDNEINKEIETVINQLLLVESVTIPGYTL